MPPTPPLDVSHRRASDTGTASVEVQPRRRVVIFVCGILTLPGHSDNWTGKAVTWTHLRTADRAEKVEYFSGALLTRTLFQRSRAERLAKMLRYYQAEGWDVVLVGHSNGCDVIGDALRMGRWDEAAAVREVHLIAPACDADFSSNGLNANAYSLGKGLVRVYIGTRDWALRLAASSIGRLMGYGVLGITGPRRAMMPVDVVRRDFGHGEWFAPEHFEETMRMVTGVSHAEAQRRGDEGNTQRPTLNTQRPRAAMSCWEVLAGISLGGIALALAMAIFGCSAGPRVPKLPKGSYVEATGFSKDFDGKEAVGVRGTIHIPLGRHRTNRTDGAYLASAGWRGEQEVPAFRTTVFLRE